MDIKKLNPWNWFSREEDHARNIPVQRGVPQVYHPMAQLHQDIDRLMDGVFRGFGLPFMGIGNLTDTEAALFRPHVDIASTDKQYTVTVEVPGVEEKDVKLELTHDGTLVIRGEKKQEKEQKDKNFHRIERSYGSFQRTLSLPEDASQENIDASFKNGVLTVTVPRKTIAQEPARRIEIKTAA
jgi:HSP20 family protein